MMFQGETNYYEILEIRPDASAQDVRNAYLRLKASFRKDNPALYSMLDPGEAEDMISKIEEAFQILSDPDARRDFDERNGFADRIERKIFAIDRAPPVSSAPPMDGGGDDMLVAPATDFEGMSTRGETTQTGISAFSLPTQAPREPGSFLDTLPKAEPPASPSTPVAMSSPGLVDRRTNAFGRREADRAPPTLANPQVDPVAAEVMGETEWRGPTLRRIRELRRYSLDDIASLTKISKNHLLAIEEEAFAKLPAPVFVRGFILQIARTLKIPPEPVAAAYLARLSKRPGA
ncbi:MAG: helix-turn-helix domain-containing protein [Bdellovibrionales bacterium]|nr:helix-turn-helix domain-containing protein [Bdellovibrionales bacterium]